MPRRLLASLVLWGFPVLCLAVIIVTGYLLVFWITEDADLPWFGYLVLLPLSVAIIVGAVQALHARPEIVAEPELERGHHPRLWQEVEAIAAAAGTPAPQRIVLDAKVNASASIEQGAPTLRLGLPLLATLTVDQLRAVIAHELGHFRGGDAHHLARSQKVTDAMDRMVEAGGLFAAPLLWVYRRLYLLVAGGHSQATERAADELALRIAGPGAMAGALRQIARTDMVEDYVDELGGLFAHAGMRAPITEAYREVLAANAAELDSDLEKYLAEEEVPMGSSHPPVRDRLKALPEAEPAVGGEWATSLLEGVDALERAVMVREWPLTSWDAVVAAAGVDAIRADLHMHGWDIGEPVTLAGMFDVVDAGDFDPDEQYFLHALVREALSRDGRARPVAPQWKFSDDGLLAWEYDLPAVDETVASAVVTKDTGALRALLAGVDLNRAPAAPQADHLMATLSDLKSPEGPVDLHISMQGLLLTPVGEEGPIARSIQMRAYDVAVARSLPGARWIPLADIAKIVDGELALLALDNKRITIHLRDGGKLSLRRTGRTTELPEDGSGLMALAELADNVG